MKMKLVPDTIVTKVVKNLKYAYGNTLIIEGFPDTQYVYFYEYPMKGLEYQNMIHGYCTELKKQFPEYDFRWFMGPINQESCGIRIYRKTETTAEMKEMDENKEYGI